MYRLRVKASRSYNVTISDNLNDFVSEIKPFIKGEKVAIISDNNVNSNYSGILDGFFTDKKIYTYVVTAGEESKSEKTYFKLINSLSKDGFTRKDSVIAFGGGVIGDLAGFVASTYMRGITLIQVPTTILSAVDSSVGGKTAINLQSGKNLVGCFYQPYAVYINTSFFKTLPEREIKSGFGEIIKYAFLKKSVSYDLIKQGISEKLIYECLKIKRDIVQRDEKESNLRALLNFGHTVGHAIESLSAYTVSHGECVVKGMKYALKLSKSLHKISDEKYLKVQELLSVCGHDEECSYSVQDIVNKMAYDKKSDGRKVSFVSIKDIGKPEIVKLDYKTIENYLK